MIVNYRDMGMPHVIDISGTKYYYVLVFTDGQRKEVLLEEAPEAGVPLLIVDSGVRWLRVKSHEPGTSEVYVEPFDMEVNVGILHKQI